VSRFVDLTFVKVLLLLYLSRKEAEFEAEPQGFNFTLQQIYDAKDPFAA
jgi:hypothetical protein